MSSFASDDSSILSGLAKEIFYSIESDTYDLGNYTEERVKELMKKIFSTPLPNPISMIKITFVVGGGKLVRSKYDENLPKYCVSALRELNYNEDKSAAETFDSQGTFKQQHDTGANLKYLIVFPHVLCSKAPKSALKAENVAVKIETTPEQKVITAEMSTFIDMIGSKVVSWRSKKRCLKILQDSFDNFKLIEAKLMKGTALTSEEQSVYDANSGSDDDKIKYLQNEIKNMVEKGALSESEKAELINSLESNISHVTEEINEAKNKNENKKIEKLEEKRAQMVQRKEGVAMVAPINVRLTYSSDIGKLYMQLFPLLAIEERARSISLTLEDLKKLEPKSDIEDGIRRYEMASKDWFEDELEFTKKCEYEQKDAKSKYNSLISSKSKSKAVGGSGISAKSSSSSSTWSSIAAKGKSSSTGSKNTAPKKTSSNSFAAFANDSDSDES